MTEEVTAEGSAGEGTYGDADIYPTGATSNVQTPVSSRETWHPLKDEMELEMVLTVAKELTMKQQLLPTRVPIPQIQDERTKKADVTPEAVRPFPSTSTDASSKPKRKTKKLCEE